MSTTANNIVVEVNSAMLQDLIAVKGLGARSADLIIAEREKQLFVDWVDFLGRISWFGAKSAQALSDAGLRVQGTEYVLLITANKTTEKAKSGITKRPVKATTIKVQNITNQTKGIKNKVDSVINPSKTLSQEVINSKATPVLAIPASNTKDNADHLILLASTDTEITPILDEESSALKKKKSNKDKKHHKNKKKAKKLKLVKADKRKKAKKKAKKSKKGKK